MQYDNKKYTDLSLTELASHNNIAEVLSEDDLKKIGAQVVSEYKVDEISRSDWLEKKYKPSLKLATQIIEKKTFPWPGASNVKFPLLLNAGLQFHARAYPALLPNAGIVTGKVVGADESGENRKKAERISGHMSYQVTDQMEEWEEGMDRLLITYSFTGTEFKKSYYDADMGRNVSIHVHGKDLVINYNAKTINTAPRITEIMSFSENELIEKYRSGEFLECKDYTPTQRQDTVTEVQDKSKGMSPPPTTDGDTPYIILEQHRFYDFDGDGYKEPYICTVTKDSEKVLRIVAAYYPESIFINDKDEVSKIERINYYTLYGFIPNPAGGIYHIGFGDLLGPLNAAVDTLINQLIDKGTSSNLGGGFISRNLRIKGGVYRYRPNEWMNVNASGNDIRNGILPLPVSEPSGTLYSLLTFLINAGERVAATTDMQVGDNPGQNQKAETSRIVNENGMKVFTAIYKRTRKALESELRKLFALNKRYCKPKEYFQVLNPSTRDLMQMDVSLTDYQTASVNVIPSADPHLASQEQKMARAQYLASLVPMGGFNEYEIKRRLIEAADIERPDEVLPDPQGPNAPQPPPNIPLMTLQLDIQKEAHAEQERAFRRNYDTQKLQLHAQNEGAKIQIADKNATTQEVKVFSDSSHKAAEHATAALQTPTVGA